MKWLAGVYVFCALMLLGFTSTHYLLLDMPPGEQWHIFTVANGDTTYHGVRWDPRVETLNLHLPQADQVLILADASVSAVADSPQKAPAVVSVLGNPFSEYLRLSSDKPGRLIVYDIRGRRVGGMPLREGMNRLKIDGPSGVYLYLALPMGEVGKVTKAK